jgi:acyl-CoA reductase-like NAD-dependent aldehyde dehydrogenase
MPTLIVDDPYTLETACEVQLSDASAIDALLDRARQGARIAAAMPLAERKALVLAATAEMEANAARYAEAMARMVGKPLAQGEGEVRTMAVRARTMVELADAGLAPIDAGGSDGIARTIEKRPLGVVLDLPAWNYPLLTAVNAVMPALLAGNAVIVKHSPRSPLCGPMFADAFAKVGADPRLVQSLDCSHELSERTVGDKRVDHVVFTGSVYGGQRISQAAAGRFLQPGYELGGSDPAYLAEDGELARAVENFVDGAMYNAGQSCCAVERGYVHARHYAEFVERAKALAEAYVLGSPLAAGTTLGPIAQPHHVAELKALVDDAVSRGARLVTGGSPTSAGGRGRFFLPTVLADVPQDARVMREEQFGPILALARVDSDEQALARMNDSVFGLTASVWTTSRERAARLASQLEFGTVFQNRCDHVDPRLPWSGVGQSGRGHSLSVLGFDQLTRPRSLHFRT